MISISREEKDYLVQKGYLKCVQGQYPNLKITSREKKGKRKRYFIPELNYLLNALRKIYEK